MSSTWASKVSWADELSCCLPVMSVAVAIVSAVVVRTRDELASQSECTRHSFYNKIAVYCKWNRKVAWLIRLLLYILGMELKSKFIYFGAHTKKKKSSGKTKLISRDFLILCWARVELMASGFCLQFTAALNFLAFFRELKVIHVKMYTINLARMTFVCSRWDRCR